MPPFTPTHVGRFEILRPLGAGGMARVYLARDTLTRDSRLVAVKILGDAYPVSALSHEAQLIASLQHPHIAQLIDAGVSPDGVHYLVVEYVHGVSLREVLESARAAGTWLPPAFGMSVVAAAAAALHHAHERVGRDGRPLGIVHRDVAPSNLMIGYDGTVKLIDFGIAWSRVREEETRKGLVKGKLGYMSPEQILGHPVDRRSDVFSLGVVAYEATAQARAFRAQSEHSTARRVLHGDVRPPSAARPGYPADLAQVVMFALATDREARYPSCEEMGRAMVRVAARMGAELGPGSIVPVMRDLFPEAHGRSARGTGANEALAPEPDDITTTRFTALGPGTITVSLEDL